MLTQSLWLVGDYYHVNGLTLSSECNFSLNFVYLDIFENVAKNVLIQSLPPTTGDVSSPW